VSFDTPAMSHEKSALLPTLPPSSTPHFSSTPPSLDMSSYPSPGVEIPRPLFILILGLLVYLSLDSIIASHPLPKILLVPTQPLLPKPGSKYTSTQFYGFGIFTGGSTNEEECALSNSVGFVESELECYLGYDDETTDIQHRMEVLRDAIELAYSLTDEDEDDDGSLLKIFVVPEFFFRGGRGSLLGENVISEICNQAEDLITEPRFTNWLFVFGTILASEVYNRGAPEADREWIFYNFAPVMLGGPTSHSRKPFRGLAPKEYVSKIDFLKPKHVFNNTAVPFAFQLTDHDDKGLAHYDFDIWERMEENMQEAGYELIRRNFFMVEGIRFSIEICLDHALAEAKENFMRKGGGLSGGFVKASQVSLLSSAGMEIIDKNLILENGGVIYHQVSVCIFFSFFLLFTN